MLAKGMFVADRYEIIDRVGAGGMSDVYKARDHILGRFVAIKVLKQEFSEDVNFVTKFRTEAQSAAGLEHPNIVNIYDVGSEEGIHYIVMEYVEGVTLKTYIEKKGQLTYKEAVSIAIQVGRGMEAAHAKHIIHRDIKPQNILISTEGKAKVTDFGIARAVSNNTISADVMGSVHYASPEQARNGFVDNRSDIYSLGIVMYEMVTGRVPFDGETTVAVALGHLQEEMVAPSAYARELPISLEKIILKCTQKSADRRYPNISDLLIDLKKVLISPNDDFVTMITPGEQEKTRVIRSDEVEKIKEASKTVTPEPEYDEDDEDEDEEYEEEDEDDSFLNPKMEKAVTIGAIVAAVIIVFIVLYFIASVFGIFKFSSKKPASTETETTTTQSSSLKGNSTKDDEEEQVTVIDVRGKTYDEAYADLHELGLGIKQGTPEYSDTVAEGNIISQDVASGTKVEKNTTVTVVLSIGVESSAIPSVVGFTRDNAKTTLEAAGYVVAEADTAFSDTVASGNVISQTPQAGTTGKKGATVTITVSKGQETIQVPNVKGQSQSTATSTLQNAGFTVNTTTQYDSGVDEGLVISQSEAAGSYIAKGSSVSLVISLGAENIFYKCKATITAPSSDEVDSADITLYDSDGNELKSWEDVGISAFPYSISCTDISNTDSGRISITWYLEDGSTSTQDQNVSFTKQ